MSNPSVDPRKTSEGSAKGKLLMSAPLESGSVMPSASRAARRWTLLGVAGCLLVAGLLRWTARSGGGTRSPEISIMERVAPAGTLAAEDSSAPRLTALAETQSSLAEHAPLSAAVNDAVDGGTDLSLAIAAYARGDLPGAALVMRRLVATHPDDLTFREAERVVRAKERGRTPAR